MSRVRAVCSLSGDYFTGATGIRQRSLCARRPPPSIGILVFTEDKKLVGSATGRVGAPDVTSVHQGPGRYYLEIRAADADWTVSVEDNK